MSDSVWVDTSELATLTNLLANLPDEVSRKLAPAVDKTAQAIASEARANAPRDTGELAGDISVRQGRRRRDEASRWVGSDLRQAFFQEVGTSAHPPQPSIAPAATRGLDTLEDELGKLGALW